MIEPEEQSETGTTSCDMNEPKGEDTHTMNPPVEYIENKSFEPPKDPVASKSTELVDQWNLALDLCRTPIIAFLTNLSLRSARHPIWTIVVVATTSVFVLVFGMTTNFRVEIDGMKLWAPEGSSPPTDVDWIQNESGFPWKERLFSVIVYRKDYQSVLQDAADGVLRVFDVLDAMRKTDGFDEICGQWEDGTCRESSVAGFWNNSRQLFEENMASDNGRDDAFVIDVLSQDSFPDGSPVVRLNVMGLTQPDGGAGKNGTLPRLTSALSFINTIRFPNVLPLATAYEDRAVDILLQLRDEWAKDPECLYQLELRAESSLHGEFSRAIAEDIPLMIVALSIMSSFCSVILFRKHRVQSQSLLGVGGVITIVLSLATGYGIMFCCGVPFTSLTQVFPFVMIGIGLDDTFILVGSFVRTDAFTAFEDRINNVMKDSGASITTSTLTTVLAFLCGCFSRIPAIRGLCFYAATTVLIDFFYQITFFVALMALDQRRVNSNRYDCLPCFKKTDHGHGARVDTSPKPSMLRKQMSGNDFFSGGLRRMSLLLLHPAAKIITLVLFATILGLGCFSAMQLRQQFSPDELLPKDSYLRDFFKVSEIVASSGNDRLLVGALYFRDVDFSKNETQQAMYAFVNDMAALDTVSRPPTSFWLSDFHQWESQQVAANQLQGAGFEQRIALFLETEPFNELHKRNIVLNEDGKMTASRTYFVFDAIDTNSVQAQVDELHNHRQVALAQPVNKGSGARLAFFSYADLYYIWEFFKIIVLELILTSSLSLAAVTLVSLFFIPHPAGAMLVMPTVAVIYLELLGLIQVAGLHVNPITTIALVMSIGLVVDYSVHIVFRFFEVGSDDRHFRVTMVLHTMGTSVFVGGLSTFLGIMVLAFSQSLVFFTFFVIFVGIVILGVGHGLLVMPVILSIVGPRYSRCKV